jgi:hypothetical protein
MSISKNMPVMTFIVTASTGTDITAASSRRDASISVLSKMDEEESSLRALLLPVLMAAVELVEALMAPLSRTIYTFCVSTGVGLYVGAGVGGVGSYVGSAVGRGPLAVARPKDVGYNAAATSNGGSVVGPCDGPRDGV